MKKAEITARIIPSADNTFGYDILLYGRPLVHQPHIRVLLGNVKKIPMNTLDSKLKTLNKFSLRIAFLWILLGSICPMFFSSYTNVWAQSPTIKIVVDNFEKPGNKNSLGGEFGAFNDNNGIGYCYLFFTENKNKSDRGKYSLLIQWDTSKEGAYGGYWTDLKHLDLETFNYLSFYVKGLKGGEKFKIGLRGKKEEMFETKILVNDVLGKGITTEWQKVIIPLKQFTTIQDLRDVNIFSVNFEYNFGSRKGSILIDDIAFDK